MKKGIPIQSEIINVYMFGDGEVSTGMCVNKTTNIPSISIAKLTKTFEVGEDLLGSGVQEDELILLSFKSLESFKVFEKMAKQVKKILKSSRSNSNIS